MILDRHVWSCMVHHSLLYAKTLCGDFELDAIKTTVPVYDVDVLFMFKHFPGFCGICLASQIWKHVLLLQRPK